MILARSYFYFLFNQFFLALPFLQLFPRALVESCRRPTRRVGRAPASWPRPSPVPSGLVTGGWSATGLRAPWRYDSVYSLTHTDRQTNTSSSVTLQSSQHKYSPLGKKKLSDSVCVCVCTCAGRSVRGGASEAQPDLRGPLGGLAWVRPSAGAVGILWWRTYEEDPAGDGEALLHPLPRWSDSQTHLPSFSQHQKRPTPTILHSSASAHYVWSHLFAQIINCFNISNVWLDG